MHQLSTFTTTFDNIKQNNFLKKKKTQQYQYLNFVDDFMGSPYICILDKYGT